MHWRPLSRLALPALLWLLAGCDFDSPGASGRTTAAAGEAAADSAAVVAASDAPPVAELPVLDLPMTVEEAYAAIPHRRTTFDFEHSSIPDDERRYLAAVFHLLDQGTRVRVVGMVELGRDGTSDEEPARRLGELRAAVTRLRPPPGLEAYQDLILEALARERAVFESWEAAGGAWEHRANVGGDPDVQAASAALRRAYGILMQRYGADAPGANADALFDVHCAFDFI